MPDIKPITRENFYNALSILNAPKDDDSDFIYDIYSYTVEGINAIASSNLIGNLQGINHLELIGYCIGEFKYFTSNLSKEKLEDFKKDENILMSISSIVADKYLSLNQFSHREQVLANRFSPTVSTLYVYINFMLNIMETYNKKDPMTSLLSDLFTKSISICKCALDLLVKGFETEAFSCWRTLHECECALIILFNNQKEAIPAYLKHMQFGFAFRDTIQNKEKQTEIFMSMKEEMKQYDLKSKDIKKYIEYGWLYSVPGVKDLEGFKLNFRDGLEKVAGLETYSKRYEMSSEIIHGTPLLVYSSREYFYFMTLLSTYESFFRLEKIFSVIFLHNVNEMQAKGYYDMRKVYYSHLMTIHKRESENFKNWQAYQKRKRTANE